MTVRAVFDTNVLLSALGWKGRPHQCLELARNGIIEGIICQELLDELTEKLETKLGLTAEQCCESVADLLVFLQVVAITGQLQAVAADPDDDKVLECAVNAHATHIVTGDHRHLLPFGSFQGIRLVTPSAFLAQIAAGP